MVVDASAIVAVLNREAEAAQIVAAIDAARGRLTTSPLAVFEATLALARASSAKVGRRPTRDEIDLSRTMVDAFLSSNEIQQIEVTPAMGRLAIEASSRYGKAVGHPADLNFGDCFAYACAKALGAPLLYKGDDFSKTDLAR